MFKNLVVHPQVATTPALAICAAGEQGKFWEFERKIWEGSWDVSGPRPQFKGAQALAQEAMEKIATDLQLNLDRFKSDLTGKKCQQVLATTGALMSRLGVHATPGIFINGRFIAGAVPLDQFKAVIEQELKKANEAIKSKGIKPEDYYQKVVVEAGKKTV